MSDPPSHQTDGSMETNEVCVRTRIQNQVFTTQLARGLIGDEDLVFYYGLFPADEIIAASHSSFIFVGQYIYKRLNVIILDFLEIHSDQAGDQSNTVTPLFTHQYGDKPLLIQYQCKSYVIMT